MEKSKWSTPFESRRSTESPMTECSFSTRLLKSGSEWGMVEQLVATLCGLGVQSLTPLERGCLQKRNLFDGERHWPSLYVRCMLAVVACCKSEHITQTEANELPEERERENWQPNATLNIVPFLNASKALLLGECVPGPDIAQHSVIQNLYVLFACAKFGLTMFVAWTMQIAQSAKPMLSRLLRFSLQSTHPSSLPITFIVPFAIRQPV